ncbi:hypothetical protein, conserved [Entamoeba dispar SAW760]|uniref:Phospholipase B-like n=1 Tax=Entamoeba dispar (strain ATCC PRA-260 / SAW760) TaxID=370354 RepID=B0E7C8_ENTDS|nr:uncharacterized protein EDI_332700 [Entamoeba dispar SAW760]EDR29576.1 hypothetical protein, conserved [Entamoeba dispar SAW760]|eukprot:EDR29576.1 hypothetical protein, conserved [Entamoeba dispar SAW760]
MLVVLLFISLSLATTSSITISLYHIGEDWTIKYVSDNEAVAVATYVISKEAKGYNELSVHTNKKYSDKEQMFATGFADGFFSGNNINFHKENMNAWYLDHYLGKAKDYPKSLYKYLQDNIDYINNQIKANPEDQYWVSVDLIMEQVRGVTAGHNFAVKSSESMTFYDMFFYESFGDLLDLTAVLPSDDEVNGIEHPKWFIKYANNDIDWHLNWKLRTKCSGLIRYVKENHDIYVSQVAWFMYGAMNRVMKHFDINLNNEYLSAKKVSFSSYPGFVFSFDDFYMTSNDLAIIETTFTNFNTTLNQYIHSNTLLDWIRIVLAVRASKNGKEFHDIFEKQNSGTYNNQWIVVDYKLFNSVESGIPEGTLTVSEQIPGYVFFKDFSTSLESTGYFGSFNVPEIQETIEMSNTTANAQGNKAFWNSPTECCRAKIFEKYAPKVMNMNDMKKMMKYNDYKNEPLSKDPTTELQDPGATIAARYDLRPSELKPLPFGQMDAKICDKSGFETLQFHVQAGPTHDKQPYLDLEVYEKQGWFIPDKGVLKVWNFDWEEFIPK